jgi:ABC-2 type transport system ATP-binding protein
MAEVEKIPGVKEAALFGKGLHVVVEAAEPATRDIRSLLTQLGFPLVRVEKIVPSLEDVFVSLIEARDRAERPQAEVQG